MGSAHDPARWHDLPMGARAMTVVRVLFITLSDLKAREEIPTDVR